MPRRIPLILAAFLLSSYVSASVINMALTLSTPVYVAPGADRLEVSILNSGDEPAINAVAIVNQPFGGDVVEYIGTIEPGINYLSAVNLTCSADAVPGVYHGFLSLRYTDLNGHPFSLVGPFVVRHVNDSQSMVDVSSGSVAVPSGGAAKTVAVDVLNKDEVGHDVSFTVISPVELVAGKYNRHATIPARSSAVFEVPLRSEGALEGSLYTIHYLAEYESGGLHRGSVGRGEVQIVAAQDVTDLSWIPSALLFALIAAFTLYQMWHLIGGRLHKGP